MENRAVEKLRAKHEIITAAVDKFYFFLLSYALLCIVLIVVWQILARNLSIANTWTEEASRWLFVWTCFIGASYFGFKNDHIVVDLVRESRTLRAGAEKYGWFFKLLETAFYILIMIGGILYVTRYGGNISGGVRLPYRVLYYSCPVSFAMMSLFSVYHVAYAVALKIAEGKREEV